MNVSPNQNPVAAVAGRIVREHYPFIALVILGIVVRTLVWITFRPAIWYIGDSIDYLQASIHPQPGLWRPSGYSFMLMAFRPLHSVAAVVFVQHALSVGLVVACYVFLRRAGVRRWVATLALSPMLLDGYAIQLQQQVLSDPFFVIVVASALLLVLWRRDRPGVIACAIAGLLLGSSVTLRNVGLALLPVVVLLLVVLRPRWRATTALILACCAPILAYGFWFRSTYGNFATSQGSGVFLYARVMPWASCAGVSLTADERRLCDPRPPAQRPSQNWYMWSPDSPIRSVPGDLHHVSAVASSFARKMILHQPLDYLEAVGGSMVQTFAWHENMIQQANSYDFTLKSPPLPAYFQNAVRYYQDGRSGDTHVAHPRLAARLLDYQHWVRLPGPGYLITLMVGVAGCVVGRRNRYLWRACLVLTATSALLLATPPLTVFYDPRFVQAALPFCCLAIALGAELILLRWRGPSVTSELRDGDRLKEPVVGAQH